jgi:putative transcriptional regulator
MKLRFRCVLFVAAGTVLCSSTLQGQSRKPEDLRVGKILVVPREPPDPAFAESVIAIVRYDRSGTVGLAINRRTSIPISKALHEVKGASKRNDPIYIGGPVGREMVLAFVRSNSAPSESTHIFPDLYLITSRKGMEDVFATTKPANELRVYAGYCGWAAGQLENEVKKGGWFIFDQSENAVFDSKPDTLWQRLVEKTELQVASLGKVVLLAEMNHRQLYQLHP